jgi:flagellar hook assembly protein FlgD
LVTTLVDDDMSADRHNVVWNGTNSQGAAVSSGVYFFRLTVGNRVLTRKAVLLK